jgi:3-oxoacyl-[acyl-carrier protein] reductase
MNRAVVGLEQGPFQLYEGKQPQEFKHFSRESPANYGRIVKVSSVTGPVPSNPRETVYSAAKAGMVGMTRSLALELACKGITVNAVAPGWIETASSTEHDIIAGRNTPIRPPRSP